MIMYGAFTYKAKCDKQKSVRMYLYLKPDWKQRKIDLTENRIRVSRSI